MQLMNHSMRRYFDHAHNLALIIHRTMHAMKQVTEESRFVHHVAGKIRRFGLIHFHKEYVQHQRLARKGCCHQCGICCSLLFTCPMLLKTRGCIIYGVCRPQVCKGFPIDQRDIDEVRLYGGRCGYHFSSAYLDDPIQE